MAIMVDDEAIDKVQSQFPPDEVCNSQYITIYYFMFIINTK